RLRPPGGLLRGRGAGHGRRTRSRVLHPCPCRHRGRRRRRRARRARGRARPGARAERAGRVLPSGARRRPAAARARALPGKLAAVSGHSKWASIKRKKGANDERRGRMFAKLLRAVEVAAREGGANIDGNMTLASAVQKARDYSVPWDNIERAIKRGAGDTAGARYEEITYEGYGPGGVAILVQALTDNRNRTGQEVRHALARL